MGTHHDVQFEITVDGELRTFEPNHWRITRMGLCERSKFYVHLYSLHLFEPRRDDVLIPIERAGHHDLFIVRSKHTTDIAKSRLSRGYKLIQRDGKPFFWPESEAA